MNRLALVMSIMLMAGAAAKADGPKLHRSYVNIVTQVDEGPTGRLMVPAGSEESFDERLKRIEEKLDRLIEELQGLKPQQQGAKADAFHFLIGATY